MEKKTIKIFSFFVISLFLIIPFSANATITWTETRPAGDVNKNWGITKFDNDGTNIIAGINTGRLYTSSDSGAIWTERQPAGNADKVWYASDIDSDGSNLFAVGLDTSTWLGRLYVSTDYGINWEDRQPTGVSDQWWNSVASDSDGSNLIAGAGGGRLYISANSGVSWVERQPAGNADKVWTVASNSDGSRLVAAVDRGRLYTSSNGGVDWVERQPAGANNYRWATLATDEDGSFIIAGSFLESGAGGRLYISTDSGATWTESRPLGDTQQGWSDVAVDSDGSTVILKNNVKRLYISIDSGTTWVETQPAGDFDRNWYDLDVTSDGSKFLACVSSASNGRIYIGSSASIPIVPTTPVVSDITTTSATLSWTDASSDETSFTVDTSTDNVTYTNFGSASADATSLSVTGLIPSTQYWFRVAAVNTAGTSSYATSSTFTTSAEPVAVVETPAVSVNSSGSRMSRSQLERILAPSASTTVYLNSLNNANTIIQPISTSTTPYNFTKNLKIRDTDEQVRKLQQYLNNYKITQSGTTTYPFKVSNMGPGSAGNETKYFGLATFKALVKFQEFFKEQILAIYGLIRGTGYFGPATRKVMNGVR